jgi:hypothetical protein
MATHNHDGGEKFAKVIDPALEGAIYAGPMYPEFRQVGPGSCPICGMTLEPVVATAEAGPQRSPTSAGWPMSCAGSTGAVGRYRPNRGAATCRAVENQFNSRPRAKASIYIGAPER